MMEDNTAVSFTNEMMYDRIILESILADIAKSYHSRDLVKYYWSVRSFIVQTLQLFEKGTEAKELYDRVKDIYTEVVESTPSILRTTTQKQANSSRKKNNVFNKIEDIQVEYMCILQKETGYFKRKAYYKDGRKRLEERYKVT